jgi:hypothetical protein
MGTVHAKAGVQPHAEDGGRLSLSAFLSELTLTGSCFCCGLPTELLLGHEGHACLHCPTCGAEVSCGAPEQERVFSVRQAA